MRKLKVQGTFFLHFPQSYSVCQTVTLLALNWFKFDIYNVPVRFWQYKTYHYFIQHGATVILIKFISRYGISGGADGGSGEGSDGSGRRPRSYYHLFIGSSQKKQSNLGQNNQTSCQVLITSLLRKMSLFCHFRFSLTQMLW